MAGLHRCPAAYSLIALSVVFTQAHPARAQGHVQISVFASGLNNPRGLTFGPDGALYVAEGGLVVQNGSSTVGQCQQVPSAGPYTGSMTSRISRISQSGERTTVVDGLPSSQTIPALGNLVSGVGDVALSATPSTGWRLARAVHTGWRAQRTPSSA